MILVKRTRDSNLANEVSAKEPFLLDHINPGAAGFQKNANNLLNSSLRTEKKKIKNSALEFNNS